jgi:60S ribosome subunit biogenesis protein NIP7
LFKYIPASAETVLKRAFNNWGIFGLYEKMDIIVKQSRKNNGNSQIEKKPLNDSDGKKDNRDLQVHVCSNRVQKELAIRLQPAHSGIIIGQVRDKRFLPNLSFAELVVGHNPKLNYPYAILEDKSSNLVMYGRDIMGNSIVDFFNGIKENQILIVLNQKKEVIGMGKSRFSGNLIAQSDKITIDNIQDIGTHYLKGENRYGALHGD